MAIYSRKTDVDDLLSFTSIFEAKTYKILRSTGLIVDCQVKVCLTPAQQQGRYSKPCTWKVDFAAIHPKYDRRLLIEAKGHWIVHDHAALEGLRKTLRMFEYADPHAAKDLIIVTSDSKPLRIDEVHTSIPLRSLADTIRQKFN